MRDYPNCAHWQIVHIHWDHQALNNRSFNLLEVSEVPRRVRIQRYFPGPQTLAARSPIARSCATLMLPQLACQRLPTKNLFAVRVGFDHADATGPGAAQLDREGCKPL